MNSQQNNNYGGFVCDGTRMNAVTSILRSDEKLAAGKRSRATFKSKDDSAKSKFATSRGIAAHSAMRQYLRTGQVDDLNPQCYPFFENLHNEVSRLDLKDHLWIEGPVVDELSHLQNGMHSAVWNKKYRYAGCPDVVSHCNGCRVLIEFKTTTDYYKDSYAYRDFKSYPSFLKWKHAAMQCDSYQCAFTQTTGFDIDAALIITAGRDFSQLFVVENDRLPKRLTEFHKLARDYQKLHT